MIVSIYIDNQKVDLFQDESINIVSSVLDIRDITKNTTEYSNSFTVPASNTNNIIFKHYYNADIDNTFDARVSVTARIEISGIVFREGKIKLERVIVRKGMPYSYMINFYGRLLSFKEIFGTNKLASLDLSSLNFDYTPTNIQGLLDGTYGIDDLVCALMGKRKYFYASNLTAYDTTTLSNLYYNASADADGGALWSELVPAIKLTTIIEAIEADYGLTFSADFFGVDPFDSLYMLLDPGSEVKNAGVEVDINFDLSSGSKQWIIGGGVLVSVLTNYTYDIDVTITPESGFEDVEYTLSAYDNGVLIGQLTSKNTNVLNLFISSVEAHRISFTLEVSEYFEYTPSIQVTEYISTVYNYDESYTNVAPDSAMVEFNVSAHMPDLTILDFFKGLIQAFKLVIIPTSDTAVYVNTVTGYQSAGSVRNLTKYVDNDNVDVSPGRMLNEINFKFQEPNTILNKTFKGITSEGYGDEELTIYDTEGNIIDGDSLDVQLPFEQIIYERLTDEEDGTETIFQTASLIDDKLAPVNVKPHIFYPVLVAIGSKTLYFNDGSGTPVELSGNYFAPMHQMSETDPGIAFIFGAEVDEYSKNTLVNNLYSEYYQDYVNTLFNIKKRSYVFEAKNLPIGLINKINLNDVIQIRNNFYRIDNFTTDIVKGTAKFNLYNVFTPDVIVFSLEASYTVDDLAATYYKTATNLSSNMTYVLEDTGDGTSWCTNVEEYLGDIGFTVTANAGAQRSMTVYVTDLDKGQTKATTLIQNAP